jgi:hypothetical protein
VEGHRQNEPFVVFDFDIFFLPGMGWVPKR